MPSGSAQKSDEPPVPNDSASVPAQTDATDVQADGSTSAPSASSVSDNASEAAVHEGTASAEANSVSEDLQRQVNAAIPRAERTTVAKNAAYEPGVVLASVSKGTTPAQFSQAIAEAGIKTVQQNGVEAVTDDLVLAKLAADASLDDAIYELESTGVAKGAQPNYIYEIAEELVPENPQAASDTKTTNDISTLKPSDESNLATEVGPVEPTAVEEQSDAQPTTSVQSTSFTAARDALNDTHAREQWGLDSIDALDAWEYPPLKNATTTVGVGVIDNGFNDSHEDLVDNIRSTYNATTKVENVPVPCPPGTPNADHGIHVAGIVAATSNNNKGISGVGFNHLKLSLVRLTDENNPERISTDVVAQGFEYLIKHKDQYNIRVASMSIGGKVSSLPPNDDAILAKIDKAYEQGIVTVASAGNETGTAIPPYINYPSDYETVVSVINLRNTNSNDPKSVEKSSTSNYNALGEKSKNISAPGTDIYSTYPSGYGNMSGTSMAAPHVSGVVGLMFAVNPKLSAAQAKNLLYSSARDIGTEDWDETYGYGEVNAAAAVRAAAAGTIAGPEYLATGSQATYTLGPDFEGWRFSSSNPDVLTISTNGAATAVSAGIVTVSASNGSSSVTQQVTVLGPITGTNFVAKDGSASLSITTPDGCSDLAWEWSSSNEPAATVTNNGEVNGHSVGTTTITATLRANPNVSLSHTVTVYDTLQGDVYVPVERTANLTPVIPSGFENPTVSWSSANEQVATVTASDNKGEVTAKKAGGAAIVCTITSDKQSVTNIWPVYVYGPIEGNTRVGIGQSTQLKVAGVSGVEDLQTGWTWSLYEGSSNEVATVSDSGVVTGRQPGTVTVTATRGTEPNTASFSHTMEVTTLSLANAKVTIPKQTYTGSKLTPAPAVTLNGTTLVAGTDHEVVDQNIVNVGSYNVVIQGKGVYAGTATGNFVVEPKRLTPPKPKTGLVYNGSEQTAVAAGDYETIRGTTSATDADEYYAVLEVKDTTNTCWEGSNSTTHRIEWSIEECPISEASVSGLGSYVYNGAAQTPKPTLTFNGKALKEGTDYGLSYANNVNVGAATVTISTKDSENFKGTNKATFNILPASLSNATVSGPSTQLYSDKFLTPRPTVTLAGKTLREGIDYTLAYSNNRNVGIATVTITGKGNYTGTKVSTFKIERQPCTVAYRSHVQKVGWQDWVRNGSTSGTVGQALRLESVNLKLEGQPCAGGIEYRSHVQGIGWEGSWKRDGATSGTVGQARRLEAVQVRLTGQMAEHYDVWYRAHVQQVGWMGWAKNGQIAGTTGQARRLEALEVLVLQKGSAAPGPTIDELRKQLVGYSTHVQRIGWQGQVYDGAVGGTVGQALRLEGIQIGLQLQPYTGSIEYRSHVQGIGWEGSWQRDGATSGTVGQARRLEAVQVRLTGQMAEHYDVWYRAHVQREGWMDWVRNGQIAGTAGQALRLEAIQIKLTPKS